MTEVIVLAGDVGGTNARLAFFAVGEGAPPRMLWQRSGDSGTHAGLEPVIASALAEAGLRPSAMSIGVAGPVIAGRCRTTNLPWELDSASLARVASLPSATLLNDVEALAWGLPALGAGSFATLHEGREEPRGSLALVSVGTGLGEGCLLRRSGRAVVQASEGGHASFGPRDAEQDALLSFLREQFGHVSWERVLSGPGLVNILRFLDETGRAPMPATLRASMEAEGAAAISAAAAGGVPAAEAAMSLFTRLLGAEAGNVALRELATGGVYLAGGIPPRLRPWLESPALVESFLDKGRMRGLLERVPLRLVLDDQAALLGAALHAANTLD